MFLHCTRHVKVTRLDTRKLVEMVKGLLMDSEHLGEEQMAYLRISSISFSARRLFCVTRTRYSFREDSLSPDLR